MKRHSWLLLLVAGCGGDFADTGGGADGVLPECFSSNECPTGMECTEFGVCISPGVMPDGGVAPPEETELEFGAPLSAERFVYIAMPELDALARIDGETLAVSSLAVGESPRAVAIVPDTDVAVALDGQNSFATIIRPGAAGDDQTTVATLPHANRVVVSPTGRFAVTWFDLAKAVEEAGGLQAVGGIGSFQDVTVLDLSAGSETSLGLAVGFRPRAVEFDAAGERAYVITDDGVSVIDLAAAVGGGATLTPPIALTDTPLVAADIFDVDISADGTLAVARERGTNRVHMTRVHGPELGARTLLELDGVISDLDLTPDRSVAYALSSTTGILHRISLPASGAPSFTSTAVGTTGLGSLIIAPGGERAAIFTNATSRTDLAIVELGASPSIVLRTTQKNIRSAGFSGDGAKLLVIHSKDPGEVSSAATFEEFVARSYGYSVLDIATGFAKLELTEDDVGAFAFTQDHLFVGSGDTFDPGATGALHIADLSTGVVYTELLQTVPDAIGLLPEAGVVFVGQVHALGRMTFFSLGGDLIDTVTGFDLNGRIVD